MKKLLAFLGIDRAISYTLIGRGWGIISGIITLLLVIRFLSPDEQGYYYTFASLLALQIFFELGMSYVVMQFASHEMAHLTWSTANTIKGDEHAKARLRSLILLMTKWYGVVSVLLILVILPVGWMFFSNNSEGTVLWKTAWTWLVFASAVNIFFTPMLALLEGCGRVTEIARLRMYQSLLGSPLAWLVLLGGGGLLAMPVMSTCFALLLLIWLWRTKKDFFSDLLGSKMEKTRISWKTEIWPFQWKIALSWLSGFFIFQLFTPVLFAYHGAVEAGKMGISISIANALMSIAMAWMSTKVPQFGTLIAKGDYLTLDNVFKLTLIRSFSILAMLGLVLCTLNFILHFKDIQLSSRFLEPLPFALLILATIFNYVTYAQAAYLRAHKQEPFLLVSLVSAGLIATLTLALVSDYGALGLMSAYLAVSVMIGFGWGSIIFFSKRKEWKKKPVFDVSGKGNI